MNDVETVSFRVNHLLQPAHLSFDAAQARHLPVVFNLNAGVRGFIVFCFVFFQFRSTPYLVQGVGDKDGCFS